MDERPNDSDKEILIPLRSDFEISAIPTEPHVEPSKSEDSGITGVEAFAQRRNLKSGDVEASSEAQDVKSTPRRVAILVTHGMGKQVPFETLSAVGQALLTQHAREIKSIKKTDGNVNVRRVLLTDEVGAPELSRVEVTLTDKKNVTADVHIYESYWAPFTEGQISFLQTVGFLYIAAWNGIDTYIRAKLDRHPNFLGRLRRTAKKEQVNSDSRAGLAKDGKRYFDRWMFGKFHDMPINRFTFWSLIAVVASISLLLVPALLLFTPAGLAAVKWIFDTYTAHYLHWPLGWQVFIGMVVVGLAVLACYIRYFVVEYVGDVAIYVSSYKVSRFDTIRNKILKEICTVSRQIYSAGIVDKRELRYDSVVIVGHSLGSVISYDGLNAAINWDEVECNFDRKVVARTSRLITFGSPLDKTAFLFRTQVSSARNLREALAARQQPLILDYQRYRPLASFSWINIYAPRDIVSGKLDYYDVPETDQKEGKNPVINEKDPEATRPILAHLQYWNNKVLHKTLYEAVWAP